MAQQVLGWAQGIALLVLVLVIAFIAGMRMFLHGGVRRGYILAADAERTAERTATIVGILFGPYVLICIVAVMHPPFGRWFVNTFITDTIIWQAQFVKWMDARVQDDLAATALGGLLKGLQFIVAFIITVVAVMMRSLLKWVLGVRHFEHLREDSVRTLERTQVLREIATGRLIAPELEADVAIEQRGSFRDRPATGYFSGKPLEPRSDRLQERLRRAKPEDEQA